MLFISRAWKTNETSIRLKRKLCKWSTLTTRWWATLSSWSRCFKLAYRISKVQSICSLAFYGRCAATRSGPCCSTWLAAGIHLLYECVFGRVFLLALMKCSLPEGDLLSPYLLLQSIKHHNDDRCQWASCPAVDENMRDSSSQNKSASFCLFVFLMPHGPTIKCLSVPWLPAVHYIRMVLSGRGILRVLFLCASPLTDQHVPRMPVFRVLLWISIMSLHRPAPNLSPQWKKEASVILGALRWN